jgi:serpin B
MHVTGLLIMSGLFTAASPPPAWSADTQAVADGANRFAADLYAQLRAKPGSRFVSPYSVHAAFALLSGAAKGATRDELARVLHLPADPEKALAAGDLGRFYTAAGKPYELATANALWGQTGYPWDDGFVRRAGERFGAGLRPADFAREPEAGRLAVNTWVEQQTRDRIRGLLPAGSVTPLTRLVLANAVYFKGDWADQFQSQLTKPAPFTRADGNKADVPLMTRTGGYRYAQLDGFQILELPYKGGELAMDVILPADHTGLPAVEAKLADLGSWLGKLGDEPRVQVHLPKFKLEDSVSLPEILRPMGLKTVFDPDRADLTGLVSRTPEDRLYVSAAFHKAFVEVNEQGTEAAAATGIVVGVRSAAPRPPTAFRADRPFLFLIRDVKHGTILFLGRYAGP